MSIEAFFRLAWIPVVELVAVLSLIWLLFRFVPPHLPDTVHLSTGALRTARRLSFLVVLVVFGIWLIVLAGLNLFPRTDIDRTDLNQQNQQWEKRHSK